MNLFACDCSGDLPRFCIDRWKLRPIDGDRLRDFADLQGRVYRGHLVANDRDVVYDFFRKTSLFDHYVVGSGQQPVHRINSVIVGGCGLRNSGLLSRHGYLGAPNHCSLSVQNGSLDSCAVLRMSSQNDQKHEGKSKDTA